jgi:signal transduction histidine kinase
MREVGTLAPDAPSFRTLSAEQLAAEYLEKTPLRPTDPKLQRLPLLKIWRMSTADGTVVALFREEHLQQALAAVVDATALPELRVRVLPPGEPFVSNTPLAAQEIGEFLPGWRLGLSFKGNDPFAALSVRQTRVYLWTGFVAVLTILMVALLVARYVGAQMRLARLKNELVSTVSHELKTPLASMRALVDTLTAGRYRDAHQLQEYLGLLAKENLRLSNVIENFLSFSRMERGQQHFDFEAVAPSSLVRAAVGVLKDRLGSPGCEFVVQAAPDLPSIRGDAEALTTVLINLLENSYKYSDGNRRIAVRIYADERDGCFEVEDNGLGIAPAETRKIFDRFHQVDQSLTRQRGGCGLGLSIVKSIVEAHHGAVEVQSELGKGSLFRVRIPLAKPIP